MTIQKSIEAMIGGLSLLAALLLIAVILVTGLGHPPRTCEDYADRPGLEAVRGTDANGRAYCYVTDGTRIRRVIR
jgi:hypothetical protein